MPKDSNDTGRLVLTGAFALGSAAIVGHGLNKVATALSSYTRPAEKAADAAQEAARAFTVTSRGVVALSNVASRSWLAHLWPLRRCALARKWCNCGKTCAGLAVAAL